MNLSKLFEMQRELDARIEREHPRKEGEDRLAKKILALQVELGELANEWRGFKYWSDDRKPNLISFDLKSEYKKEGGVTGFDKSGIRRVWIDGVEIPFQEIDEYIEERRPLLEEYVDCLHFILSIGLEIETKQDIFPEPIKYDNMVTQFNELFGQISYFASVLNRDNDWDEVEFEYERVWSLFFGLGGELGFTWDEIEQSYIEKNKVNHERQVTGY